MDTTRALGQTPTHRLPGRHGVRALVCAHPVDAYFVLAVAASWSYWVPDALAGGHWSHYPGLVGPAAAAVVIAAISGGRERVGELWRAVTRWRVASRFYVVAVVPIAIAAVVVAVQTVAGSGPTLRELGHMKGLPELGWLGVFAASLVVNGFGEETGWRGFAWPGLRGRYSFTGAAVRLGVVWALWHLPLFWIDSGMRGFSIAFFPMFAFSLIAGAAVLGWLYDRTRSVVVVALWHTALNMATATDGTSAAGAVVSIAVILLAVAVVQAQRGAVTE